ncbi:NAD-dependent protein deacetylase SIR4 [Escovopsis weberi]|uniref:NAD-dependent protein deacetylase SIR4 n=1 Tax=Escovopsis weberi TaxID=150374 RepID=A0A0N0RTC6_ESCWE|nr:NAD-dependent protein deacetylase SIR4 [Escovopsis weberi]
MRIPYTNPFPPPAIIPPAAATLQGAVAALEAFLLAPPTVSPASPAPATAILSGAGLSVASGLADYRGPKGTYRLNKAYRPIYHHEFLHNHESRKRYWARSFLGWTSLHRAAPNAAHHAIRDLARLGLVASVVTQNVDSFHLRAHPAIPSVELHGYLRSTVCTSCHAEFPRDALQADLARLNPRWAAVLDDALAAGAFDHPGDPPGRAAGGGFRTNPDGDVDIPGAPYTSFRYPPCPRCLADPPPLLSGSGGSSSGSGSGSRHTVAVDRDGAWVAPSTAGILKPAVVLFGASISPPVKQAAEDAIDLAGKLLVLGTSLATYSAWRLARRAKDRGIPIAVVNMGGVRGEEAFFDDVDPRQPGHQAVRTEIPTDQLLPALASHLHAKMTPGSLGASAGEARVALENSSVFKDMLS